MKTDYKNQIDDILSAALTEKTFNLEIVEKIKTLRDDFTKALSEIDRLTNLVKIAGEDKAILNKNYDQTLSALNTYKSRETDLATREKAHDKMTYELDFQNRRANEIRELFGIVFKNPVVRENVYKNCNTPVAQNGYISTYNHSDSESKTVEKE